MADSMVEEIKRWRVIEVERGAEGTKEMQLPKGHSLALMAIPATIGGKNG